MNLEVIASPELLKFGHPSFATPGSAAIDLRALLNSPLTKLNRETRVEADVENGITAIFLAPGEQVTIDSGLRIHIADPNYAGLVLPRSSSGKKGLVLANGTGLIDSDYQGPLLQMIWNRSGQTVEIKDGDRISQYLVTNVHQFELTEVEEFSAESERGEGGFGSTGSN